MAKITKSIRLGLTPELLEQIRTEAKRQKVSVNALIRNTLKKDLTESNQQRFSEPAEPKLIRLVDVPVVQWSQAEQEYADKVIKEHFDEDRNEIIR